MQRIYAEELCTDKGPWIASVPNLATYDVPCNQFAGQTLGTDEEIHEFCTLK